MQHTCNIHATHMQHEHFPCKFPSNVAAGAKIYTFHSKTGVGAANVKSCTSTVNLQVKSSCCMSCCMCVACVLHVRCMAGVQDRAVTLSKWRACHAERQPVHPTTLRNQVKKVSRLSLHVFHLAQPILAHMRPRKQTDTPTHKHPPKLIPMLSLTHVSSSFSRLSAAMGPSYCVFSESGFFKKNSHPMKYHTTEVMPPRPPIQCCLLKFVFGGLQKKTAISVDDARHFRSQH